MAFQIPKTLSSMRVTAGEAMVFSFQPQSAAGVAESLTGRAFGFSLWDAKQNSIDYIEATIVTGADSTQSALFTLDGTYSRKYFGQSLKWGLFERKRNGDDAIAIGSLTVDDGGPALPTLTTASISSYILHIVRMNDVKDVTTAPVFDVIPALYGVIVSAVTQSLNFSQGSNSGLMMML